MNETVRLLLAHRSSRSYKSDPIPAEILDAIIESAHRAPTSINSQQISLVVVRNAASRARIAEIAGAQPWIAQAPVFIAVVADFYKTGLGVEKAGAEQVMQRSLEAIVSAVSDAGIAMAALMTAARWSRLRIRLQSAATAIELLDNDAKRQSMRSRAYHYARQMVGNRAAQS